MGEKKSNKKKSAKIGRSRIYFIVSIIATLGASYYVYRELHAIPEKPKVDLNIHWGPYPLDQKPDQSIKPYSIEFSEVMINELKSLLLHRRPFQPPLEDSGFTYGFNTHFLNRVLDYWQNKYNFVDREKFFNKYNHYITKIQGLDIHYVHVKPNVSADIEIVPLLLLHGWPGSFREFYEIIPELAPKLEQDFALELIIPSLPGYGFSQGPVRPGMGPLEMAVVMKNLMERIGHKKYYVQGGDVGHTIGSIMATLFTDNVLGLHTNFPMVMNSLSTLYTLLGAVVPSLVVEPEIQDRIYPLSKQLSFILEESGYMHIQATKPDTIGIALTDSPAGLAAYILEKFSTWTNPDNRKASDGNLLSNYMLTHLLDNVMVYWVSNSITTSMRVYAESLNRKQMGHKIDMIPTTVPTWGIKFKHELVTQPDLVLKLKYLNYLHTTVVDGGGHFAAFESPKILAKDIIQAIITFREFWGVSKNKGQNQQTQPDPNTAKSIHEFTIKDIYGRDVKLDKYKGYVLLIVNVASQCGLTDKNYNQLNELYNKYSKARDFRILAFPCNQFNGQEPGSSNDIIKFINERGVKFDVFEKVEVNGEDAHPLWKYLKRTQSGTLGDFIKWNFSKFIIDKNGVPVERFGPNVDPIELEPYLAKYW